MNDKNRKLVIVPRNAAVRRAGRVSVQEHLVRCMAKREESWASAMDSAKKAGDSEALERIRAQRKAWLADYRARMRRIDSIA